MKTWDTIEIHEKGIELVTINDSDSNYLEFNEINKEDKKEIKDYCKSRIKELKSIIHKLK